MRAIMAFLTKLLAWLKPLSDPPEGKGSKMGIAISSGHGAKVKGAVGILNEVTEARRVVRKTVEYLAEMGVIVHEFHDDESNTQPQNLDTIIGWHNEMGCDFNVSIHFNAFVSTNSPMRTEVLMHPAGCIHGLATRVAKAVATAGWFRNRGVKFRSNLRFLNGVRSGLIVEVCFVDSLRDTVLYESHFDSICLYLAMALAEQGGKEK